jgi:hypothetical protein
MGRYITGDIERKLWFAVQSSNAADRFGSTATEPYYLEYYFDEENNLEKVQEELQNIENIIGIENIKKLDEFFDKVNGYNDNIMMEHNILEIWNQNKSDYADYKLGKDIEECLIRKGYCNFQAEL